MNIFSDTLSLIAGMVIVRFLFFKLFSLNFSSVSYFGVLFAYIPSVRVGRVGKVKILRANRFCVFSNDNYLISRYSA